jgi:hypothetical protein
MGTMQRKRRYFREFCGLARPKLTGQPVIPLRDRDIATIALWDARWGRFRLAMQRVGIEAERAADRFRDLTRDLAQSVPTLEALDTGNPVEVAP